MSAEENLFTEDRGTNLFGGDTSWGDELDLGGVDKGDEFVPTDDDVTETETEVEADAEVDTEVEAEPETEHEAEVEDDGTDTDVEEEAPSKGKKDSNPMVPRQRLNKEIQKRQQLEARIRDLETQSAVPPAAAPVPVKEAVKPNAEAIGTMFSAVLDGDEAKAQTTLEQILTEFGDRVVTQALAQSKDVAEGTYSRNQELNELRTAAAEVTEQYPEFDQNSAEVDMGLTEEVLALRDSLIDRGEKPAAALRRAAKLVALENGITARGKADLAKPPVQSKPKDVAKQIVKATQTPGRLKGEGAKNKEVKLDIMKLSDEQFGKLSRDALAKARGDFF